ncbi:MAG: hypothetical protein ACOYYJ_17240 [Chloroflexota bacterium]
MSIPLVTVDEATGAVIVDEIGGGPDNVVIPTHPEIDINSSDFLTQLDDWYRENNPGWGSGG